MRAQSLSTRRAIRSSQGLTMIEALVVTVIIAILAAASFYFFGGTQPDKAKNTSATEVLQLGATTARSLYLNNEQALPGGSLTDRLGDSEPALSFTSYTPESPSDDFKNVSTTRDSPSQVTMCVRSDSGFFYCERSALGRTQLRTSPRTEALEDTVARSRCVGVTESAARACLATHNHPAYDSPRALVGWGSTTPLEGASGTQSSYVEEVFSDDPTAYCSFDETGSTPIEIECAGSADAVLQGPEGSVLASEPGAITSNPTAGSVRFSGTLHSSYAAPTEGAVDSSGDEWSAEAWVKKAPTGAGAGAFVSADNSWVLRLAANSGVGCGWKRNSGSVNQVFSGAGSIEDGRWYHIVCVWDAPNYRLYVDGELADSGSVAAANQPTSTDPHLRFGYVGNGWATGSVFGGWLDEFAFYPQALSPQRVQAHYGAAS